MADPLIAAPSDSEFEIDEVSPVDARSSTSLLQPNRQGSTGIQSPDPDMSGDGFEGSKYYEDSNSTNGESVTMNADSQDDFEPIPRPPNYPALNFRPMTLQNWLLAATALFYLGCIAGILVLMMLGRWQPRKLHMANETNHMALQYVPGVIGTLSTIMYKAIVLSHNRMMPYVAMASVPDSGCLTRSEATRINRLTTFMFNVYSIRELISDHEYAILFVNFMQFLSVFTLTSLKNSVFILSQDSTGWSLSVSSATGIMIIGLYMLLLTALSIITKIHWKNMTGLKWDPAPLAAQLSLAYGSNIHRAFSGMEFCDYKMARRAISSWTEEFGTLRLGYWQKKSSSGEGSRKIVYGVRFIWYDVADGEFWPRHKLCIDRNLQRLSNGNVCQEEIEHHFHRQNRCLSPQYPIEATPRTRAGRLVCSPQYARYNIDRFSLLPGYRILMLAIGIACICATLFGINSGKIYDPIDYSSGITGHGPDSFRDQYVAALVYSTLPGLLFALFNVTFLESDYYYRMMRPIRGMDRPSEANNSILIDYISPNIIKAWWYAFKSGHFRLAWYIKLAMLCNLPPIIAGKIFFRQYHGSGYSFVVYPRNLYITLATLCIYCVSMLFAGPPGRYRATRRLSNFVDTLSFCYDSGLARDPLFKLPAEAKGDPKDTFYPKIRTAGYRYQFGMYLGVECGRRHLGFDRLEKIDVGDYVWHNVDRVRSELTKEEKREAWRARQPKIDSMTWFRRVENTNVLQYSALGNRT